MIRLATIADVPAIEELGIRLKRLTPYATWPYVRDRALAQIRQCVGGGLRCAFVAEHEGQVRGFLLGIAQEQWHSNWRSATDFAIYSEVPLGGFLMVEAFVGWAWSKPTVHEVLIGQSSGLDQDSFGALLERLNFQKVGGLYQLGRHD